jgi:hypothetical protein
MKLIETIKVGGYIDSNVSPWWDLDYPLDLSSFHYAAYCPGIFGKVVFLID